MPDGSPCPNARIRQRLLLGDLREQEALSLEEHVAACALCLEVIRDLKADDLLVHALRTGAKAEGIPEDEIDEGGADLLHAVQKHGHDLPLVGNPRVENALPRVDGPQHRQGRFGAAMTVSSR